MRKAALIPVLLLCFAACTTRGATEQLRDRVWTLTSIDGFTAMPAGVATPTIRFDTDGRLSGNTGCNSAGAAFTTDGDRLTIQPMMVTKRACLEPEGNRLERAYVQAVGRARRFRIAENQLELLDDNGTVLARFRAPE